MGVSEDIRQKMLPRFRETTADRVERIAGQLLEIEKGRGTAENKAELLREFHTLKGEARMMGFPGISAVVHAAEEVLKSLPPEGRGERVDALRKACDSILPLIDAPGGGGEVAEGMAASLRALQETDIPATSPQGPKGDPTPPLPEPRVAPSPLAGEEKPEATRHPERTTSIRVDVDRLDEIGALAGDVLVEGERASRRARELTEIFARWAELTERVIALADSAGETRAGRKVEQVEGDFNLLRSDTFRFARSHTESTSFARAQFAQLAERISSARLIPLSGVLAAFPDAAREMAKEQGKEVECQVKGGETGVDRTILLALNDPLVHLVRNAVDHGIETPDERLAAQKPRAGRITLSARVDGDLLTVIVEDDGRGISPEKIRSAALERGVIGEQQAQSLSARGALELVFTPGFSTRIVAGETSGRGVGLDVVRKRVVALGGSVSVESEPGHGSAFKLRMPQSLSLMKALLVRVDDDAYGIPAIDVEAVGRLEPKDVIEVAGVRTVRWRNRFLPVVALGPLFSLNGGPRSPRPYVVYVAQGAEGGAALVVDGLFGEREVAVKGLNAFLKGMPYLTGAAALDDGRVALLLSTSELVAGSRNLASPVPSRGRERRRLRVLLVDDSAIAREVEAALLRSLGHEVEEAVDGEDAWEKLLRGNHHLLIADVQMPVLDGIDLTRRVKATARFAKLPVVILSSLKAPEERRRGVDAGADAYIVKGELQPESLAVTLERLCGVGG